MNNSIFLLNRFNIWWSKCWNCAKEILKLEARKYWNVEQWPSCRNRPVSFETRLGRFVLGPDQMPDSLSCWAFLSLSKKKKKKKGSSSSLQAAGRLEPDSQERHRPPARRFHLHWGLRPASPRLRSQAGKASAGRLPNPTRGPCRPLDLVERLARPCSCSEPRLGGEWCFSLPPPCICLLAQPCTCILRGFDSAGDSGFAASVGQVSREYYCAFTRVNFHWPVLQRNRFQ